MSKLSWNDAEEIGEALFEKHPDLDPLKVRFTDLHKMITELDDFGDDPKKSSESKLEAVQMAWHNEWKENQ
ncbi:MAG: Fe-S cluster assembly protein IscX [Desulfobulbaceae bacterium]|nr:Fe-S cluster assembly protein IscX [Desulfobulbaceae bacterium]